MSRLRSAVARIPAGWWFTLLFVAFCSVYEYGRILHLRPLPHHLMRQTDCLGQAWNYAFVDGNFFHPRMMNLHADDNTDGESAGEFPLLYWIMGMVWRLTGQSEFLYRLFGLLLHFAGSYALFRATSRILRSDFWGGWVSLLFFTSPAIVYFAISFLPDVPALDMALIGAWMLARYMDERKRRYLFLALGFMALGALLKVTAGMLLLALLGVLFLETTRRRKLDERKGELFVDRRAAWIAFAFAVALVFAWYGYASRYNGVHGAPFTPNGLWPIWTMRPEELERALWFGRNILFFEIHSIPTWVLLIASCGSVLVILRRLPWQAMALNLFLIVGGVLYLFGWFHALNDHDYYFINPQMVLMVPLVTALWWLGKSRPILLRSVWMRISAVFLLLYSLAYAATDLQMRTWGEAAIKTERLLPLYSQAQLDHWNESDYFDGFGLVDLEPIERSLGITRDDLVLSARDRTWQASLYLMGRRGWNDYTVQLEDSATVMHYIRERGASYFVLTNKEWMQRPYLRPFLHYPMARNHEVRIFDLRPFR